MNAPTNREPTEKPIRSVYVHVPFCRHRCGYCDFTLVADRDDLIDDYLIGLSRELERIPQPLRLETLFLGGGTPSHLPPVKLADLFARLRRHFGWDETTEVSIEANPRDLTSERIAVLADCGVNRLSLGVQSFDDRHLRTLERDHDAEGVRTGVEIARERIDNIGFDLIFGVPDQSPEDWADTLETALALEPTHLSTYGLTFERGTAFWSRLRKGTLTALPAETEREMFATAIDRLTAAGFDHYEISNFARPGFRCRHNIVYWNREPFEAFGPGAARLVGDERIVNHRSVSRWLKGVADGTAPRSDAEHLSPDEAARERLVLGLRMLDGITIDHFETTTGFSLREQIGDELDRLIDNGWLTLRDGQLKLTREGIFLSDEVAVELV